MKSIREKARKMTGGKDLLEMLDENNRIDANSARSLCEDTDPGSLIEAAASLRDQGHGSIVSYSPKIFIPLTQLCRDVCHYCTFAQAPRRGKAAFLTPEEVLSIAHAGAKAGCHEALFTLGDKPELRYQSVRDELKQLGFATTLEYLRHCSQLVYEETGLLPHVNPGIMNTREINMLRQVSVSQGIMLESISPRLLLKGEPHYGSPDKAPELRLDTIRKAGQEKVAFTSGILIGIGETRMERIDSLLALRDLNDEFGHLQEIIIQNFRPKPDTKMAEVPAAPLDELLWTIAAARLLLGPKMNIQAPPNLSPGVLPRLINAGINDWGGISPVTPDHVNPEAAWPQLELLQRETEAAGKVLVERLPIYPTYVQDNDEWLDGRFITCVKQAVNAEGFVRSDNWIAGETSSIENANVNSRPSQSERVKNNSLRNILKRAFQGQTPSETEIVELFATRGEDFKEVCKVADELRSYLVGEQVSYVVNRNINYTNVCYFRCQFCAFSKGKGSEDLRGAAYDLEIEEIQRRTVEAWNRGATEVCMQGGIHPNYTGETYLNICRAVKQVAPDIHIHAFSPLEIWQGAATLGITPKDFLMQLKQVGLGSLPGTAAEILDDEIRAILCPDKIKTQQWLEVMETAHNIGLRTTATIMFGHVEKPVHWARHLLRLLDLQKRSHGFTEFVPLPFVHMESPIYLKGNARQGPTLRESILMHAIARLVFHSHLPNIQASWVKLGVSGLKHCLQAGVNDVGGSLMNETITRSAGATHGQEMAPETLESVICSVGRIPRQRTTLYEKPPLERRSKGLNAAPIEANINSPVRRQKVKARNPIRCDQ